MSTTTAPGGTAAERIPRKAALASFVGSMLEYYDFFIYGAAAGLVFPHGLLPGVRPRHRHAAVAGHVRRRLRRPPDRRGHHRPLRRHGRPQEDAGADPAADGRLDVRSSGCCRPTPPSASPPRSCWSCCAILQGLSAAGEQSGANSLTLEHAPDRRRGFFTSFTLEGTQGGLILANLVFLPVAALPGGPAAQLGLADPVLPLRRRRRRRLLGAPLAAGDPGVREGRAGPRGRQAAGRRPASATTGPRCCGWSSARSSRWSARSSAPGRWPRARATRSAWTRHDPAVDGRSWPTSSRWSPSRCGRSCRTGSAAVRCSCSARWARPCWSSRSCGRCSRANVPLIFVFGILLSGLVYSAANGIWPSFYGEMFDTRVRYSGMAIGTQIGFALGGFSPAIAAAIVGDGQQRLGAGRAADRRRRDRRRAVRPHRPGDRARPDRRSSASSRAEELTRELANA